jgi:hypothetical protein
MYKSSRKKLMEARLDVRRTPSTPQGSMDRHAFEERSLPHLRALYGTALRLPGDASAAEDLVQETYLKGLQSFATLRDPDRGCGRADSPRRGGRAPGSRPTSRRGSSSTTV